MTTTEQAKIEKLVARVQSLLPKGWRATRGFFLDMWSLAHSPDHVSISRSDYPRGKPLVERLAWKAATEDEARQITNRLKARRLRAYQDGTFVYVTQR